MYKKSEQIGRLNRQVWIQRRSLEENAHSEKVETWKNYQKVYARQDYPTTKSDEVATDAGTQVAYTFCYWTMRYHKCVSVLDRIVDDRGNVWNIQTVADIERNTWLKLGCEKII